MTKKQPLACQMLFTSPTQASSIEQNAGVDIFAFQKCPLLHLFYSNHSHGVRWLHVNTTIRTWMFLLLFCHRAKRLPNEISLGGCKSYNMRLALVFTEKIMTLANVWTIGYLSVPSDTSPRETHMSTLCWNQPVCLEFNDATWSGKDIHRHFHPVQVSFVLWTVLVTEQSIF